MLLCFPLPETTLIISAWLFLYSCYSCCKTACEKKNPKTNLPPTESTSILICPFSSTLSTCFIGFMFGESTESRVLSLCLWPLTPSRRQTITLSLINEARTSRSKWQEVWCRRRRSRVVTRDFLSHTEHPDDLQSVRNDRSSGKMVIEMSKFSKKNHIIGKKLSTLTWGGFRLMQKNKKQQQQ